MPSSTAFSSKCGQCHVEIRGTRVNTDLLVHKTLGEQKILSQQTEKKIQNKSQDTGIREVTGTNMTKQNSVIDYRTENC